jgi:hypothetical protein
MDSSIGIVGIAVRERVDAGYEHEGWPKGSIKWDFSLSLSLSSHWILLIPLWNRNNNNKKMAHAGASINAAPLSSDELCFWCTHLNKLKERVSLALTAKNESRTMFHVPLCVRYALDGEIELVSAEPRKRLLYAKGDWRIQSLPRLPPYALLSDLLSPLSSALKCFVNCLWKTLPYFVLCKYVFSDSWTRLSLWLSQLIYEYTLARINLSNQRFLARPPTVDSIHTVDSMNQANFFDHLLAWNLPLVTHKPYLRLRKTESQASFVKESELISGTDLKPSPVLPRSRKAGSNALSSYCQPMLFRLFPKVNPVGGGSSPAVIGTQQYLEVLEGSFPYGAVSTLSYAFIPLRKRKASAKHSTALRVDYQLSYKNSVTSPWSYCPLFMKSDDAS